MHIPECESLKVLEVSIHILLLLVLNIPVLGDGLPIWYIDPNTHDSPFPPSWPAKYDMPMMPLINSLK